MAPLVEHLESLGATKVLTYDDLNDRSFRGKIKEWTQGKVRYVLERIILFAPSHYISRISAWA